MANTKLTLADELPLAQDIAAGVMSFSQIADKWGLTHQMIRAIACGQRRPRVRQIADQIIDENVKQVIRLAKSQAKKAVYAIMTLSVNQDAKGLPICDREVQRRAAMDMIELATRDVAELNTQHHKHDGNVVVLADVLNAAGVAGLDDKRIGRLMDWDEDGQEIGQEHEGGSGADEKASAPPRSNGHNGNGNGNGHSH